MKAMEVARRDGRIPFVPEQIDYTLQAREAEYELIPIAVDRTRRAGMEPHRRGLLSGKTRATRPRRPRLVAGWSDSPMDEEDRYGRSSRTRRDRGSAQDLGGADRARVAGSAPRGDVAHHRRPHRAQFRDNLASVDVKLIDDERERSKGSLPPLIYPTGTSPGPRKTASAPPTSRCTRGNSRAELRACATALPSARFPKRHLGLIRRRLVAFVVRIEGSRGKPAFRLGVRDISNPGSSSRGRARLGLAKD